ncbi:P-loop containing nucleoside triphosphate hydrolase protein [Naviculisporaceae sp. PSN 640]
MGKRKNIVPWASPPTARVIQFSSGDEVECRFEGDLTTLMVHAEMENDLPKSILETPDLVLVPSSLLSMGEMLTDQEFFELIDKGNFDDEFGDGDSSDSDSDSIPDLVPTDFVANKIEAAKDAGCDEYESALLESVIRPDDIDITFDDIHVDQSIIRALRALTSLANIDPQAFTYGVLAKEKMLGVLLHGPPGTGKTLLAKAVAKEAHTIFLHITAADFLSKWLGDHVKFVRAIFSLAKKLDPCIIFIDEADNIFKQRNSDDSEWRRDVKSQFLLEWDGVKGSGRGGFVMAATNLIDEIDPAFLRRLPRRIFVAPPSAKDREAILKLQLKDEKLGPDVDLEKLAKMTTSYTGSDLKSLCVAAAMSAVYDKLLDSDGALKTIPERKKSRRRKAMRRVLCLRHFEQGMLEVAAANDINRDKKDEKKENRQLAEVDDDLVANFKPFGQLYADNEKDESM